jgi:glutathione peroxidase-family protein
MKYAVLALPLLFGPPIALAKEKPMSFHELSAKTIDMKDQPLSSYKGRVLLVVNTASECGNTPQYADLERLHQKLAPKGFTVLGFPSNDFGGQEPGSEADIKKFCSLKYKVTFPMFAKVKTKGDGQSPVYQFLTAKHGEPSGTSTSTWWARTARWWRRSPPRCRPRPVDRHGDRGRAQEVAVTPSQRPAADRPARG